MGFSRSVEAELTVASATVNVSTWNWPDYYNSGPNHVAIDAVVLTLTPTCLRTPYLVSNGHPVSFGTLAFWPAGTYVVERKAGGHTRNITCAFKGTWFRELTGLPDHLSQPTLQACVDLKNPLLYDAMLRLGSETLAPGFAAGTLVEGLSLEVAVEIARHLRGLESRTDRARQILSAWQMKRVTQYIDNFSGYIPDVDELAALCGISSRHFRRLFKETTNQTLQDYARNAWAEKAKLLLSDTCLSLKQVSSEFGFAGPGSFTMAFRRATGQAPTAYRRQESARRSAML